MNPNVTDRVRDVLVDVDYPATKDELLSAARRRGADEDAIRALRALPPVDYGNEDEVLRSVGVHPADRSGETVADQAERRREHTHPGLAEHMKDTDPS